MREADLAIIGAGVAGLTAAKAAANAGLRVLVIERMGAGGQVMNVEQITNFPAHPQGVAGYELGPMLQMEAEEAGAEFMLDLVQGLSVAPDGRHVLQCEGEPVTAHAVLVAAGSRRRHLGVTGEDTLAGRGVSHCASCDGPLFRAQPVCVVGGGDSAFQEALVLAGHADKVTVVFREARPHAQEKLVEDVAGCANIELVAQAEVVEITGEGGVTGITMREHDSATRHLPAQGVFVYAGLEPETGFLGSSLRMDAAGRIETDASLQSSVAGVFAAGDIRSGTEYLLGAVARDGETAAQSAVRYVRRALAGTAAA